MILTVGARSSPLSRAQVEEVHRALVQWYPDLIFLPTWVETTGDLDRLTSLLNLETTDFFTKEIDALLLAGKVRIAIHSAKDLPDPLPRGLVLAALTQGVDPADLLVLGEGKTLADLPLRARIGTSSQRRIALLSRLRKDLIPVDIRGTIAERLSLLDRGLIDGVIIAKAALLRLQIVRSHIVLEGEVASLQGKLAIVSREDDREILDWFAPLDSRIHA